MAGRWLLPSQYRSGLPNVKRRRLCKNSEAHPYVGVEREQRHSILELDDQFFDFSHRLGGIPANAGDLAGLVKDWLCEISVQIRTGNTDDWRQYWNEETDKRRWKPKHEDACRNALLLRLQERLPQGVDAQHEVQYARAKRADIRISCADFQVPVEAKRNNHRDLWSACKNQLIKQYTTDPATGGYGIYLVFWFGKEYTQAPPSGTRPARPQVLQEQLKAALSEDEARKISVCVIDVSGDLLG